MLQSIVFDHDGTMSPTDPRQFNWFYYWWNHPENKNNVKGKTFPFKDLKSFMEIYNQKLHEKGGVQNFYNFLNLKCDMNDPNHPVWPAYEAFKLENPSKLYPGVKTAVKQIWEMSNLSRNPDLNKRILLGINTTNTWRSVSKDLQSNGILKYFDFFVTEEVLRKYHGADNPDSIKKPSKVSLALALGLAGSEGKHTMHIGDTLNDLSASQKVIRLNPLNPETLITVGVSWGYEGRKNLEKGVEIPGEGKAYFNHIVDKPKELVNLVKKYNSI